MGARSSPVWRLEALDPGGSCRARAGKLPDAEPDLAIAELRSRLAAAAIQVSPAAISRFLNAAGLT